MTNDAGHITASICARLCLRHHGQADSLESAMGVVKTVMANAVQAAVEIGHAAGCEVEVDGDYLVAYPSVEKPA